MRPSVRCSCLALICRWHTKESENIHRTSDAGQSEAMKAALDQTTDEFLPTVEACDGSCAAHAAITRGFLNHRLKSRLSDAFDRRSAQKRGSGRQPLSLETAPVAEGDHAVSEETVATNALGPLELLCAIEGVREVIAEMERLLPEREVATMKMNAEGFNAPEIAAVQGRSPAAVRAAIKRSRRRLRVAGIGRSGSECHTRDRDSG